MGYYNRKVRITLHRRIWEDSERCRYKYRKMKYFSMKLYVISVNDTCPSVFSVQLPNTTLFCVSDRFVIKDYEY